MPDFLHYKVRIQLLFEVYDEIEKKPQSRINLLRIFFLKNINLIHKVKGINKSIFTHHN